MLDFKAKMHQIMGSLQLTALPRAQAGLKGPTSKVRGVRKSGEGEGKEGEGKGGTGREGRKGEGKVRP